jgi:hypothetical protein
MAAAGMRAPAAMPHTARPRKKHVRLGASPVSRQPIERPMPTLSSIRLMLKMVTNRPARGVVQPWTRASVLIHAPRSFRYHWDLGSSSEAEDMRR